MLDSKVEQFCLSKDNTNCIKGIFAILVLFHHLYQETLIFYGNILGEALQCLGYLSVAMFFFISGYGLNESYKKSGKKYLSHFLRNRVLPLYAVIILMNFIYLIVKLLLDIPISKYIIIKSFFFGGTIIEKGWYLQTILLFYIFFYAVYSTIKKSKNKIVAIFILICLYIIICKVLKLSSIWYEGVFAWVLGIVFSQYIFKFEKIILHNVKCFAFLLIVFLITMISQIVVKNTNIVLLIKMISTVVFSLLMVNIVSFVKINYSVTRFLGGLFTEIYVTQGIFLMLFHSNIFYINNALWYILSVTICTILFSFLIHPVFDGLMNIVKRGVSKV